MVTSNGENAFLQEDLTKEEELKLLHVEYQLDLNEGEATAVTKKLLDEEIKESYAEDADLFGNAFDLDKLADR